MNEITRKRIYNLMEERNVKQMALALEIGVTQATLSRNINGIHEPKAEVIEKIAKYFNVSTDYLLGNTDEKKSHKLIVADADGTITPIEYDLINKVKGFTTDDLEKVFEYVDFIKSKKEEKKNEK